MKQTLKKRSIVVLCIALCIAMLVCAVLLNEDSSLSNTAYASSEASATENLTFSLINDGTEYRVNAKNRQITEAIIPANYNGLPVTEIMDNGFISCTKLMEVYIPNTVTKIGNNAFMNCSSLEEVNGMSKVKTLGNNVFSMCKNLNNLILPHTLSTLGNSILRSNPNTVYSRLSLDELTAMNPNWKLSSDTTKYVYGNHIVFDEVYEGSELKGYAIKKEQSIITDDDIVLGDTLVLNGDEHLLLEIGEQAFTGSVFKSLTLKHGKMTISANESENPVQIEEDSNECTHKVNIASSAFMVATTDEINFLVDITFDDHRVIDYQDFENGHSIDVFTGSTDLKKVTFPDTITIIPRGAFSGCENLTQIATYSKGNAEVNLNHLSDNITSIGSQAFVGCSSLKDLYLPDVRNMGNSVFQGWGDKEDITQTIHLEKYLFHPHVGEDDYNWDQDWTGTLYKNVIIQYKPFSVLFDKDGGTGGSDSIQAIYGQPMPVATKPEKTGYNFLGYFRTVDEKELYYYDEFMNSVKDCDFSPDDATLVAKWTKKTHSVNLNYDEGKLDEIKATYDEPMPAQNKPIKVGSEFHGYFTQPNGAGVQYYDENMESVRNWDIDSEAPVDLYAYWIQKEYTITFDTQGGTGGTILLEGIHYNDAFPLAERPKKPGYVFKGYYSLTGEGTRENTYYTNEMVPTRSTYDEDKDLLLYADWELITYHMFYDLDGGKNSPNNPMLATIDDHVVLSEPTKAPLAFLKWLYEGSGISSNLDELIVRLDEDVREIKLKADWTDTHLIYVSGPFSVGNVSLPKVLIYMGAAFNSNCIINVASTTQSIEIFGYNGSYNMNIVVDSASENLSVYLHDITIKSHSDKPVISASDSTDLSLYTYQTVNIYGSRRSDGSGSPAITCKSLTINCAHMLTIKGGDGKNGADGTIYTLNGESGGNAGPGVKAVEYVKILCNNVTIFAGKAGNGGNAHPSCLVAYRGEGGNGANAVIGEIIMSDGITNVTITDSEDGTPGEGMIFITPGHPGLNSVIPLLHRQL